MKLILKTLVLSGIIIGIGFTSCSKDEDQPTPEATVVVPVIPPNDPCNGDPGFCMNYGSVNKSGAAKLFVFNANRIRVYWDNGSGSTFEQVELDIYGITSGTYNVDGMTTLGTSAKLQYFSIAGGTVNPAYGTVTVSTLDTINGVTGTFNVTMQDSTKVTNGKFTSIVK